MFPLARGFRRLTVMNRRLAEDRIRHTCRELLGRQQRLSGRALRRELKARFDAVGNTARVFAIWREELEARRDPGKRAGEALPVGIVPEAADLMAQLQDAEGRAAANLERAERAELREQAHQDKWGLEIDRLRQELHTQPRYAADLQRLQTQITHLQIENAALRDRLSVEIGTPPLD
jgi:hypothetical protein